MCSWICKTVGINLVVCRVCLKLLYCLVLQESVERRKVHEQLQVLRGNIRVECRVRPPSN